MSLRKEKKFSDTVVPRVLHYLNAARQLEIKSELTTSSEELSKRTGISAFLIRKDLANFGKFGRPGMGYDVSKLKNYLVDAVGGRDVCNLIIAGVGNLGAALLNYKGFEEESLKFVAAFDSDKSKIGKLCGNVIVEGIDSIKKGIAKKDVHIGVIAVPADNAQAVAEKFVEAGIASILNFAHTTISVPPNVILRNVDLSIELKALRYFSVNK